MKGIERTRKKIAVACFLFCALLALSGCEPETIGNGLEAPLKDGAYIIDYAIDDAGTSTRSIHQGMPANRRISSLTYLLYAGSEGNGESQGDVLLKCREIPDISEDTKWPLKRETMTWKQREALKDTLDQRVDYKVVFVANIDSSIVKWTADGTPDGTPWCPLREAGSFSTAYLQLPAQPFTDSDMFYLFTTSVNSGDKGADREHPYDCPVLLQRVVTRTDFFAERFPEWNMNQVDDEGNEVIPDTVKTYFLPTIIPLYSKLIAGTGTDAYILESAKVSTNGLLANMDSAFQAKAKEWTPDDPAKVDSVENAAMYMKYATGIQKASESLKQNLVPVISVLASENAIVLVKSLLSTSLKNDSIRTLWKQSWRMDPDPAKTMVAEVGYDGNSGADKIFLDWTTKAGLSQSARIPADTMFVSDLQGFSHRFDGFSLISYGLPENNKIKAINWYAPGGAVPDYSLMQELQTNQGGNEWYQITYRPILSLDCLGNASPVVISLSCKLETLLPLKDILQPEGTDPVWTNTEVEDLWKEIVKLLAEENFRVYNYSAENSTVDLSVGVPDLSKDEALQINSEWKVEKHR
ncbi:hypothetical protein [Parabacteroides johnsonii]|uniref:hypothetical protein n=1 Tax=Parabacteroides johnsonii TaxID=387661 RepID=UPI001C9E2EF2|nr:hypothetical protein [Parabacteroides johnsonii]